MYECSDCNNIFEELGVGVRKDGLLLNGCPKCGCGQYKKISATCINCVEFTWNWHKHSKCVGSGNDSIKICKRFLQIKEDEAKKRLKVLGIPGLL